MLWGGRWEEGSCLGTHVRIKDFKIKKNNKKLKKKKKKENLFFMKLTLATQYHWGCYGLRMIFSVP